MGAIRVNVFIEVALSDSGEGTTRCGIDKLLQIWSFIIISTAYQVSPTV